MTWSRRSFVKHAASCAAHLGLMAAASPWLTRALWAAQERFPVVAREAWGRLERVAEGVWALVSTPLDGDRTTLCNGGIVAGRTGVLVVEAFGSDAGARWMAEQARALTGRTATHVVLTHYHADHTPSDVSLELADPSVVFCGDLVWNGMFPNYVDAIPSRLSRDVRLLRSVEATTYVPGHGPLAAAADLDRYVSLLDDVEAAARRAMERGLTAEAVGAAYRIPADLGEWTLFNPRYFERAIGAWMKELGPV